MSSSTNRLDQVKDALISNEAPTSIPWDPNWTKFPSRKELPNIEGAPEGAAWVWGKDDFIGRLNLLTPARVKKASSEIKTGEMVPLDLPLNVPNQPGFGREKFVHSIKVLVEGIAYDDLYQLNTQSGTQWDGFRHFAHIPTGRFYNNTTGADIHGPDANTHKCSIHHWSEHGISGRGILLDYRAYAHAHNIKYSTFTNHAIPYSELEACGKYQGIDIRPAAQGGDMRIGDILLIRSGFVEEYYASDPETRNAAGLRDSSLDAGPEKGQAWGGLKQEEPMLDWLHDCYFAAVAGDAPAFEVWPTGAAYHLHEYLLALWGVPLGEMWDLERLAEVCRKNGRWTFFLTSSVSNVPGGVASHPNATAIF